MDPANPTPAPEPLADRLALDAAGLGRALGLSVRAIRRLDSAGKLPRAVRLSRRCVRWRLSEIEKWLAAGAPARGTWETMQRGGRNGDA